MSKLHWEQVYGSKAADAVSWYAPRLEESLNYVRQTGLGTDAAVLDVGGGEATLVDDLLEAGYRKVSVLDISARARLKSAVPGWASGPAASPGRSRMFWNTSSTLVRSMSGTTGRSSISSPSLGCAGAMCSRC